jgi:dTDP-4-dehydrorhamnose 3,5-epimerase
MLDVIDLVIPGVKILTPDRHEDDRGFFSEVYNMAAMEQAGIDDTFVQDNHSLSADVGTIRGLHFQIDPNPIAKLIRVTAGSILDVVVDLRHGSPTYGAHEAVELSAANWRQLYAPVGIAHGFCTLEADTEVTYKVTGYWSRESDRGVAWDDPALGIEWPVDPGRAVLSDKDRAQPRLQDLPRHFEWVMA